VIESSVLRRMRHYPWSQLRARNRETADGGVGQAARNNLEAGLTFEVSTSATKRGLSMSDSNEVKIQRWQRYIEECRREATLLSPDGQQTMQTVIDSYERLIAMARSQDKKG
jgi:hypothetical protein